MNRFVSSVLAILFLSYSSACSTSYGKEPAPTVDQRVAALIGRMMNSATERKAFSDLEALGCPAVPAIIAQMDDRRSLPDKRISLRNKSSDAFEAFRYYGPGQVVDALAAILNQETGQDFGFIYNGGTEAERDNAVRGWRRFLQNTPSAKLCYAG